VVFEEPGGDQHRILGGIRRRTGGRGGGERADRFSQIPWATGPLGQPVLTGATAIFECRLATALLWETHHILVGRVLSVRLSDRPEALLYGQRAYRKAIHLAGDS